MLPVRPFTVLQFLLLSQHTEAFLGHLFRGGEDCSCPCRTNTVRRCIQSYETTTHNQYNQHHHQHHRVTARNVTETECQVCRHIQDTEMVDSFKW